METINWQCYKSNGYGLIRLQKADTINETDYFAIELRSNTKIAVSDCVVLITDYPFELEEKFIKGEYVYTLSEYSLKQYFREEGFDFKDYAKEVESIKMSKLFINYPMGVSEIQLYDNTNEIVLADFKVNIVSDKLNEGEFVSLVNYVESKSVALWANYSLLKNEAQPNESIDKNDWQLLFIKRLIKEFDTILYTFEYDKLTSYKKEAKIVAYNSDVLVDEDSTYWLAQNLDTLCFTNSSDSEKILIQNRLFRPYEILTNSTIESTDIEENRFVHGFIDELISFLINIKDENLNFGNPSEIRNFQEILYFYSQKRKRKLFTDYLEKLKKIKSYLLDFIPVSEPILDYISTHRISSKDHYQFVYNSFVEWFSHERIKFSNNKIYFKGVTRMDKLFERACLYKLIDVFTTIGYESRVENKKDGLPQLVSFQNTKNGKSHNLYFESYPDNYDTQTAGGAFKPDFFIEFSNNTCLILDAKYKKNSTVQKYDWEKLSLKYLHGIGNKNGGYFNPIGMFAIVPSSNNKTGFYQNWKYDLNSYSPALPSIGSVIVDFEQESTDLFKYMSKCIELVYK